MMKRTTSIPAIIPVLLWMSLLQAPHMVLVSGHERNIVASTIHIEDSSDSKSAIDFPLLSPITVETKGTATTATGQTTEGSAEGENLIIKVVERPEEPQEPSEARGIDNVIKVVGPDNRRLWSREGKRAGASSAETEKTGDNNDDDKTLLASAYEALLRENDELRKENDDLRRRRVIPAGNEGNSNKNNLRRKMASTEENLSKCREKTKYCFEKLLSCRNAP